VGCGRARVDGHHQGMPQLGSVPVTMRRESFGDRGRGLGLHGFFPKVGEMAF